MQLTMMTMLMVMTMIKETTGEEMVQIDGSLVSISVGPAGVWGVTNEDKVYYREDTYGTDGSVGSGWIEVPGFLNQVDVGSNIVWGVNKYHEIFYRIGISSSNPIGTSWEHLEGELEHISVNPDGNVWGVNWLEHAFIRFGAKNADPTGYFWKKIDERFKQISTGRAGVWGVDRYNNVQYRKGTFDTSNTEGTDWIEVPGKKMTYLSSASDKVFGLSEHKLYVRKGMTKDNPTGTEWVRVKENDADLETIDAMSKYVWSTKKKYSVWYTY